MTEPSHVGRTPLIGRPRNPDGTYSKDPRHASNRDVEVGGEAPRGSGPRPAARAHSKARRTPRLLARYRAGLAKVAEDLAAGRLTPYKADVMARSYRTLIRVEEKRLRAREQEQKNAPKIHVIQTGDQTIRYIERTPGADWERLPDKLT